MNVVCIHLWSALLQTVIGQRHLYQYIEAKGSFYFISQNRSTFDEASKNCLDDFNGHVASFDNHSRDAPFLPLLEKPARYLIGLYYNNSDNFYQWQHNGLKVDYDNITNKASRPGIGNCVIFTYKIRSWELRSVNCTKKFRFICRSYDPRCSVINIDGFHNQILLNGNYTMHRGIQASSGGNWCDSTTPIYVKTFDEEYICYDTNHTSFSWYKERLRAAIRTSMPFPHLFEFDGRARIYEWDSLGNNWTEPTVKIKCLTFNLPKENLIVSSRSTVEGVLQQHMLTIAIICASLAVLILVVTPVSVMCRRGRHRSTVPVSDDKYQNTYENVSTRNVSTTSLPSNAELNMFALNNTSVNNEDRSNHLTEAKSIDNSPYVNLDTQDETTFANRDNQNEITYASRDNQVEITYANQDNHGEITYANRDNQDEITYANHDNKDEITYTNHVNQEEITYANCDNQHDITYANQDNQDEITYVNRDNQDDITYTNRQTQGEITYANENGSVYEQLKCL